MSVLLNGWDLSFPAVVENCGHGKNAFRVTLVGSGRVAVDGQLLATASVEIVSRFKPP